MSLFGDPIVIDPRIEELLEQSYLVEMENSPPHGEAFGADVIDAARQMGYIEPPNGTAAPGGPAGLLWQLTDAGRPIARSIVRRHRLAECLLHDVLAVSFDQIDSDACRFEHVLREGLDDKICSLLGHPAVCPHTKPIPPGECCARAKMDAIQDVSPLSAGQVGQEGAVAYLSTRDQREVQKLMAIGILPGTRIRLVRKFPSFVFQMGFAQFTIDAELADKIFVHWQTAQRPEDVRPGRHGRRHRRGGEGRQ